mmetsp:Transcript_32793/g.84690  ORF Transcript_32793/g.84690 Transcript_32793/m.84690 type:complete len:301 (-) Transcript_32793:198-1100(-)
MQSDEVIWNVINQKFCAFKVKTKVPKIETFCRNEYNFTGLCNRQSCPLANSKYATIKEIDGACYLMLKTVERAHSPKNMWEKIKLNKNYTKALEELDQHLAYWPKYVVHKNKQRLTKIHQYLIRMRKMKLNPQKKLVTVKKKEEKREGKWEAKAERAAKLDETIKNELLERLKAGTYGDIYNFPQQQFEEALDEQEEVDADEEEEEVEYVEDELADEDFDDLEDLAVGFHNGDEEGEEESEGEGESDDEDDDDDDEEGGKEEESRPTKRKRGAAAAAGKRKKKIREHVMVEYDEGDKELA